MLRSFLSLTKKGFNTQRFAYKPALFFTPHSFFCTALSPKEQAIELKYLAKIIGTTYYKHNDEVNVSGDVRLLDEKNKLLGVYSIAEAKKKCNEMKLDLLLINTNTKPVICKALDYKQELYKKFVKEVFEKDLPKINKEILKRNEVAKSIKLGSKMTISDLKTKVVSAQAAAKQSKNLRIYMQVTEETEANGKNILYTFRDLAKDFLVPKGEIEENEMEKEEEEEGEPWKKDLDDGEEKIVLSQTFHSLLYQGQVTALATKTIQEYTEDEIAKIIKDYVRAEMRKSSAFAETVNFLKGRDSEFMDLVEETRGTSDVRTGGRDTILNEEEIEAQGGFIGLLQKHKTVASGQNQDIAFGDDQAVQKDEVGDFFQKYIKQMEDLKTNKQKIETLKRSLEYKARR